MSSTIGRINSGCAANILVSSYSLWSLVSIIKSEKISYVWIIECIVFDVDPIGKYYFTLNKNGEKRCENKGKRHNTLRNEKKNLLNK